MLLVPIAFTVAKRTGTSMVFVGIPMVAGLSVVHGLVPPHPAALIAVTAYNADIGRTIAYALLVGIPTAALAGPRVRQARVALRRPRPEQSADGRDGGAGEAARPAELRRHAVHDPASRRADAARELGRSCSRRRSRCANDLLRLAGNSVVALLIALLVSFYTLGCGARLRPEADPQVHAATCLGPDRARHAGRRRGRRVRPHPDGQRRLERGGGPRDAARTCRRCCSAGSSRR